MPKVLSLTKLNHAVVRLGGLHIAIGMFLMTVVLGSPLIRFFDIVSLFVVLFSTVGLIVWTYGQKAAETTLNLTRCMAWPQGPQAWGADRLEMGAEVAQGAQRLTMLAGWTSVLIGCVQILWSPDMSEGFSSPSLGPAMAVNLLPLVYALMMNMLLWIPLERYCKVALKRGPDVPPDASTHVQVPAQRLVRMFLLGLIFMMFGMVMSYCVSTVPLGK